MVLTLDILILIIGLLLYGYANNPKLAEIGRIMFGCAMLALLFGADRVVQVLRGVVR